ncbi:MAG: MFS transporter [Chromatiales bacterium]|nr:MFS transporter [Chromatiales bacterium]
MTDRSPSRANLAILAVATMLNRTAVPMIVLVGGLSGLALAPDPALATLPIALNVVGLGLCTYPAASVMRRIGRRAGFVLGSVVGGLAAIAAAFSIAQTSFAGLCASCAVLGANQAFVHQYRFAAAENVPSSRVSHAISLLLVVGLVSAFAGPELGRHGRDWMEGAPFAGAFLGLAAVHFLAAALLAGYRDAGPAERTADGAERPLRRILAQPSYVIAVAAAMSYAVMTMMMTAAPISMHAMHGFGLDVTAWAIEGHVVAMFLPSVITGTLISRAGVHAIMFTGVAILAAAAGVAWIGESAMHYAAGLVLLGVGWNFLFTAGSTLITTTYRHSERFKAQGLNDLLVFGTMALITLAAGVLLDLVGWRGVLLCTLPFLAVMLALLCFLPREAKPSGEAG